MTVTHRGVDRVDKERAYLLHHRSYSETSLICYFFTRDHGIVHILIKGARRPRGGYPLLQPTLELLVSWSGKSELKTLRGLEAHKRHLIHQGDELILLLYVAELLMKLLKPHDSHPQLYDAYDSFLTNQANRPHEKNIRLFEHRMFAELGYGLCYDKDYKNGKSIAATTRYIYDPMHGFTQTSKATSDSFLGSEILAMKELNHPKVLLAAKRLSRLILHHLLDDRPLISRQLFSYKNHSIAKNKLKSSYGN